MNLRSILPGLGILLAAAAAACSTASPVHNPPVEQPADPDPPGAWSIPDPHSLKGHANRREASEIDPPEIWPIPGYFYANEDSFNALTENAEQVGLNSVRLTPTESEIAYAIYAVQIAYQGRYVPYLAPMSITVNTGGNNKYWVGLYDFQDIHWRFAEGPLSGAQSSIPAGLSTNSGDVEGTVWFVIVADRSDPAMTINELGLEYPATPLLGWDYIKYDEYIEAVDGTQLATTLFMPLENTFFPPPLPPPFPVVLFRTPYDRELIHDSRLEFGGQERSLPGWLSELNVVLMTQYFRGRLDDSGALPDSTGTETLFREHAGPDHTDAIDAVDWLEDRAFYNGKLLLTGPSAMGVQAYQAAAQLGTRAAGLYAINSSADIGDWAARSNGCFKRGNVEGWINEHGFPVALYQEARNEFDNPEYWTAVDFDTQASGVRCPGYHETGWWDTDVSATIDSWRAFNAQGGAGAAGAQRLIIGPWSHDTLRMETVGELTFPTSPEANNATALPAEFAGFEGMLWALNLLERNPLFDPPANRVLVYFMGEEGNTTAPHNTWASLPAWPPSGSEQTLYLTQAGLLSSSPAPAELTSSYSSNPVDHIETVGGEMLPVGELVGPADQSVLYPNSAILSFRGAALGAPLSIAGEIRIDLFVETSATDTDFMVKLIDQYPDGRHMLVCDNAVRLSELIPDAIPGEVYQLSFKLGDRAYVFGTGHNVGIDVQSTNFPRFDINPGNGDTFADNPGDYVIQNNTLHFGPEQTTSVTLPVFTP